MSDEKEELYTLTFKRNLFPGERIIEHCRKNPIDGRWERKISYKNGKGERSSVLDDEEIGWDWGPANATGYTLIKAVKE